MAGEAEDSDDDEIVVVPYVKPPPTVVTLSESDGDGNDHDATENTTNTPSRKKSKRATSNDNNKSKNKRLQKKSAASAELEKSRRKSSSGEKHGKGSTNKNQSKPRNSKRRKSMPETDNDEIHPNINTLTSPQVTNDPSRNAEASVDNASESSNAKGSGKTRRVSKVTGINDNASKSKRRRVDELSPTKKPASTTSIFHPSSSALLDPVQPDIFDYNHERAKSQAHNKKKKHSRNSNSSDTPKSSRSRTRTTSKSAEEESREDSLRFAQRLGLPVSPIEEPVQRVEVSRKKTSRRKTSALPSELPECKVPQVDVAVEVEVSNPVDPVKPTIDQPSDVIITETETEITETTILPEICNVNINSSDPAASCSKTNIYHGNILRRPPDIYPTTWTPEMKRYYGELTYEIDELGIQSQQSNNWEIWRADNDNYPRKTSGIRCLNCNERGHTAAHCTDRRRNRACPTCGGDGHNDPHYCPNALCLVCGLKSKVYEVGCYRCVHRTLPLSCKICGMQGHDHKRCPDDWRRYYCTTTVRPILLRPKVDSAAEDADRDDTESNYKYKYVVKYKSSCANCGSKGHNYFHCKAARPKPSYFPNKPYIIQELPSLSAEETEVSISFQRVETPSSGSIHVIPPTTALPHKVTPTLRLSSPPKVTQIPMPSASPKTIPIPVASLQLNLKTFEQLIPEGFVTIFPVLQVTASEKQLDNFCDDVMTSMFDIDERLMSKIDLIQAPIIISRPFSEPSDEQIAVPVPFQVPSSPSSSSSTVNHSSILNSVQQASAFFSQSEPVSQLNNANAHAEYIIEISPPSSPEVEVIDEIVNSGNSICSRTPSQLSAIASPNQYKRHFSRK